MTHKPQSDIFSSLPHLIALANKKELIENNHYTWEEQAMRLQAKMAKPQYLQYLIQPPLTTASSSSSLTDLDTINLLNSLASIKDNSPFHNSSIIQLDISRDGNGAGTTSSSYERVINDPSLWPYELFLGDPLFNQIA
ncbi:hypothetical protein QYF36_014945 [Acer negundo]|nr:hypothetical protein QYF36_014945 [Acer negundo]